MSARLATNEPPIRKRLEGAALLDVGDGYWEVGFRALGSECELFYAAPDRNTAEAFCVSALDWLAGFETRFSRFLPDSVVSQINANAGVRWTEIDQQGELMLDICDDCHVTTRGAFDATSLPLSLLWDWKRKHDALPTEAEIAAAKHLVGWSRVKREPGRIMLRDKGMMLDFGGVGKEFAVDCLIHLADFHDIKHIMVDLGGDIAVLGEPPEGGGWYVGLEDPAAPDENCYCGIRLRSGGAVATSGDYRRCFNHDGLTYGHILDCRTGRPVANGTRAASVIAPSCVLAGLLSTSAMVVGGMEAIRAWQLTPGVEGCLWSRGHLLETRGFRRTVLPDGWDDDSTISPTHTPALT
ncbi:MAG: FAD:protein FMN transferase [Verrucomicrobia bacterium]|nr:FAD:protein FMN transferase [Verrucomicrobiota bacterium]